MRETGSGRKDRQTKAGSTLCTESDPGFDPMTLGCEPKSRVRHPTEPLRKWWGRRILGSNYTTDTTRV